MKIQISGNGFCEDKQFSGVYLQQGRMLLDADWNEQVNISKSALKDAVADVIGSGIPKNGGVTIDTNGRISKGIFYANGERVELKNTVDLLKSLPAIPTAQELIFYADLFEREITAVEDPDLCDPALYGADTCTRTQKTVQSRWIKKALFSGLPQTGKSRCKIQRMGKLDPCLFRLEIHDVNLSKKSVTLKWSFENGAEQYRADEYPKDFAAGNWVYEYFDAASEQFYGFNPSGSTLQRPGLTLDIDDNPGGLGLVRRWDGFATIEYSQVAQGVLKQGKLSSLYHHNGLQLDPNLGQGIGGAIGYGTAGNIFSVNLGSLLVELSLDMNALFVGDYWQVKIREPYPDVLLDQALPNGYRHHYIKLAEKKPSQPLQMVDGPDAAFPSLTTLTSGDIAGATAGQTVAQELQALADKDADQDGRLDACESDIAGLKETIKQNEQRLALWGRGVVAGFIPAEPEITSVGERLAVSIKFTSQTGTLIDGTGALWMNTGASGMTYSADGVFTFHKQSTLISTLQTKYNVRGITISRGMDAIVTYTDNPLLLVEILQAYTNLDLSKLLSKADDFDPKDFVKMDTGGTIETPIYVYPENDKLKTVCAYFRDENASDELIFDISRRTQVLEGRLEHKRIPRTATDKYTRAGTREAFKVIENAPRTARIFKKGAVRAIKSAHEKEWADYSCFSKTIAPNDGQVCVGSLIVVGKEAAVVTTGREQVYTSPFRQVSPLFKAESPADTDTDDTATGPRYDIQLTTVGSSKIATIKAYRDLTGVTLADAKAKIESGEPLILEGVDAVEARKFKAGLEAAGATVKLITL
jgi:ribosomal protein L7/L12